VDYVHIPDRDEDATESIEVRGVELALEFGVVVALPDKDFLSLKSHRLMSCLFCRPKAPLVVDNHQGKGGS
jgi:hypothetical protein